MEMFKSQQLLVPVNYTDASKKTLFIAAVLANRFDKEIVLIEVISPDKVENTIPLEEFTKRRESTLIQFAREALGDWFDDITIRTKIFIGVFRRETLKTIRNGMPELVALPYINENRFFSTLLTSAVEHIIKNSPRPVWLVPHKFPFPYKSKKRIYENQKQDKYGIPKKFLVPIDFSKESAESLDNALNLAVIFKATVYVVYVANPRSRFNIPFLSNHEKIYKHYQEQIHFFLNELMGYERGVPIKTSILIGSPAEEILKIIKEEKIHITFLAIKQKSIFERVINATVSSNVLKEAPCTIMTILGSNKLQQLENRFQDLFKSMPVGELQEMEGKSHIITEEDLYLQSKPDNQQSSLGPSQLLLGFYSKEGIKKSLEHYGIFDALRKKGFDHFIVDLNTKNPFRQEIKIYHDNKKDPSHLITENYVHEGILVIDNGFGVLPDNSHYLTLYVDWICIQNPNAKFDPSKPRLPGQEYPGIGIGFMSFTYLTLIAKRLNKDGIINHPQHYYNADLYHEQCRFVKPEHEAIYLAIKRDTMGHNFGEISWALEKDMIIDKNTNKPVPWEGWEMVYPIHDDIKKYLSSDAYHKEVQKYLNEFSFYIDWEAFEPLYKQIIQSA
jgi:nucleotide-binding universal stress UspA family protein